MKVFIMMQKEGRKQSRVREVYLDRQKAEDFIGEPHQPTIECECCGQQKSNPKYYDAATEKWKKDLFIIERTVDE